MDDVLKARFERQLLGATRAPDAPGVAGRLLAVQAQDLRSMRLALRGRAEHLEPGDVERAFTRDRSLVVGWLNRGTLHLVRREDYWWLHALTTPPLFTANARRLVQTGVDARAADRGVATIERALAREGPLTRDDLRERLDRARVPTTGQALVHVLMLACLRGIALRGPFSGGRHCYVGAAEWLPRRRTVDRDAALGELARRYLAGHAPADERDLAKWAGLPLRDARTGLARIAAQVIERGDGLLELADDDAAAARRPRPCLLDQWDPVLVGWRSRDELLREHPARVDPAADFRPFAYVGARAVATWRADGGAVRLDEPFARVSRTARAALDREAAAVTRFLAPAR